LSKVCSMITSPPAPVTDDLWQRSLAYAAKRTLAIDRKRYFGFGSDGVVWRASSVPGAAEAAVKVFERNYESERDAYLRLADWKVEEIEGFKVPTLVKYDDALRVIEMHVVTAPFILDFWQVLRGYSATILRF